MHNDDRRFGQVTPATGARAQLCASADRWREGHRTAVDRVLTTPVVTARTATENRCAATVAGAESEPVDIEQWEKAR